MHSTTEPLNEKALARHEADRDLAANALHAAWEMTVGFGSTIEDAGTLPQVGRHWPRCAFTHSGTNEPGIVSERPCGTAEICTPCEKSPQVAYAVWPARQRPRLHDARAKTNFAWSRIFAWKRHVFSGTSPRFHG